MDRESQPSHSKQALPALVLGALGVVYGDIGTSPLYALRECFAYGVEPSIPNVYGLLSLFFWALALVISGKYAALILHADNRGEGGVLALMTLVLSNFRDRTSFSAKTVMILGIFGTSLLYGDSVITPAISVLSAVEGFEEAAPALQSFVLPIAAAILTALFMVQRFGTARIGAFNGPIMLVWFIVIGLLGLVNIAYHPRILAAINPLCAIRFFLNAPVFAFVLLGSVVLAITGGEALYADLGHFGRKPIQIGWYFIAMPGLLLNYFGQGAAVLAFPTEAIEKNLFYFLAPRWALYPMVLLSTAATIIASQALISGAYSLTRQAVLLGYIPRLRILHTSQHSIGQIYVPMVNWLLFALTLSLALSFKNSANLAGAYGVAVTATNIITSLLLVIHMRRNWNLNPILAYGAMGALLISDVSFFSATALKIPNGGWFPIMLAACIFCVMTTWIAGRALLGQRYRAQRMPFDLFLQSIEHASELARVPRTAVFLSGNWETTPVALLHNMKHNLVLHEKNLLLSIVFEEIPHVPEAERIEIRELQQGFFGARARYGFMESPSIKDLIEPCKAFGIDLDSITVGYFLGRENIRITRKPGMARWRRLLFAFMARNAEGVTAFLEIPANQVVELGVFVEL